MIIKMIEMTSRVTRMERRWIWKRYRLMLIDCMMRRRVTLLAIDMRLMRYFRRRESGRGQCPLLCIRRLALDETRRSAIAKVGGLIVIAIIRND